MKSIDPNRKIEVMGILNLTPDSFFAPSRYNLPILESGADIVDIGAVSTRLGAAPVHQEEEWKRLRPVLELIRDEFPGRRISIDTFNSETVRRAYDIIGPFIVNDVTAGDSDPRMLLTAGELGLTYIPMHHGPAGNCSDILSFYDGFGIKAEKYGITDWIVDPGFGFGKTLEQNYGIFHDLGRLRTAGHKILVGISRKSMIYKPLGITPEEALPQTSKLHVEALEMGADIIRVHDVEAAFKAVRTYREGVTR